ncbi:MAG TPA: amidohydrolase [Flavisolibacter sp.]
MSSLTFTLVQSDLAWEDKAANLGMFAKKINQMQDRTQVVILPEMFSTGFSMNTGQLAETMEGSTLDWMEQVAAEKRVIVTGSAIIEENGHFFNRLVWMQPDGTYGIYDKRHLFAFGGEDKHFTAGTNRFIASVNGWKINLMVCYDLRFPVWARQSPQDAGQAPEYDVLVYVANWPEKRITAWKTLLQARAIENQCYVIGVNRVGTDGKDIYYNGNSMVIDPLGEILYEKADAEDIFTITLDRQHLQQVRERFQFLRDADNFMLLL